MTDILCPKCGQTVPVDPTDEGPFICPSCGEGLPVLQLGRAPRPTANLAATEAPVMGQPPATMEPAAAGNAGIAEVSYPAQSSVPPRQARAQRRRWSTPTAVAVGVAVLVVAGLIGYLLRGPIGSSGNNSSADIEWERSNRAAILQLKSDAEALVITGNLAAGHEKYRQLQLLIAAHAIHDPVLYDAVQNAKDAQERVYAMLLTRQETALGYYNPTLENPPPTTRAAASNAPERPILVPPPPASAPLSSDSTSPPASAFVPSAQPPPPSIPYPAPPAASGAVAPAASTGPSASATDANPAAPAPVAEVAGDAGVIFAPNLAGSQEDRRITESLNRGVAFLLGRFKDGELIDADNQKSSIRHQGLNALCVYALLHAAEGGDLSDPRLNIHGPFLEGLIDRMKSHPMASDPNQQQPVVYARSLRAAALAVFNREQDRKALKADVDYLISATTDGAYTYDDHFALLQRNQPGGAPAPSGDAPSHLNHAPGDLPSGPGDAGEPGALNRRKRTGTAVSAALLDDSTDASVILIHNGERPWIPPKGWTPPPSVPSSSVPPPSMPPPQIYIAPPEQQPRPDYQSLQSDTPPTAQSRETTPWDNSNSQYGLLGVWAGAEAGVEVPTAYWRAVQKHWLGCELKGGEWFYSLSPGKQTPTLQMTCAGIASLLITHDYLDAPALGARLARNPYSPGLTAGLNFLEDGDNVINIMTEEMWFVGYNLYGIERCALASGYKYFGTHDWFAELSQQILPNQFPNGAWGRTPDGEPAVIDTAYIILFLSRGQHPVLMNKLRFDPYWDNRPRDLANLTKFASHELERPFNWQVVNLQRAWSDWMDSPILYIASHQPPKFTDADIDKLRSFAEAGGLIFTHADGGSTTFNDWVPELANKLFPQYGLVDMPANHELFSVNYRLKNPPKLKMISNGSRLLLIHSPTDISPAWQERDFKAKRSAFEFGVNLFLWAAGRGNFRHRLDSPYIPEPANVAQNTITVARVKYDGAWNPEPYAWTRFGRYLQSSSAAGVKTTAVEMKDLHVGAEYAVAAMTGNTAVDFTDDQIKAVRDYVESGGTLLIDACGGSPAFAAGIEQKLLPKAFPNMQSQSIPPTDPLVAPPSNTDDLAHPQIRQYTAQQLGSTDAPPLRQLIFGKGRVICTSLDLTTALLGTNTWGISGYTPAYAQALIKSLLLATRPSR